MSCWTLKVAMCRGRGDHPLLVTSTRSPDPSHVEIHPENSHCAATRNDLQGQKALGHKHFGGYFRQDLQLGAAPH